MAATSSKKGKKKGKTVNLNDFLSPGPSNSGGNDGRAIVTVSSWADTMDEEDEYSSSTPAQQIALPTAPRAAREDVDLNSVPDRPPFTAHIGNLSYDVDEAVLRDIFDKMEVTQVRLQMEMGRSKGYGYVEFADKQSLIDALGLNGETFFNRKIRVDVATQSGNDRGGRYGDRDGRQGNSQISGEGDADDDWRGSAATNRNAQPSYSQRDDSFGGRRGYDDRDGGSRRGGYEDREGSFGGRRGYGDRDGGFGGRRGYDDAGSGGRRGYGDRDGVRSGGEAEGSWSRGPARSTYDDQSAPRSRGGYDSSDYGPRRGYDDGPRRDGYSDRDYSQRSAPSRDYERAEAPRERPRLQLAPRTKPVENGDEKEKTTAAAPSVFGNAKPVDTSAREREIEERLRKEQQSQQASGRDDGGARRGDGSSSFASRDIRIGVERRVDNHTNREVGSSSTTANADKVGEENGTAVEPVRKPSGASAASVFGGAKPVDTSAREREIEERLQKSSLTSASEGRGEADPTLSPDSESKGYGPSSGRSVWNKGPPPPSSHNTVSGVSSSRGGPPSRPHYKKERKLPQSIDEMPVYKESSTKDFSDGNIYSGLLGSDGDDDQH